LKGSSHFESLKNGGKSWCVLVDGIILELGVILRKMEEHIYQLARLISVYVFYYKISKTGELTFF
jgi:hypothetical protein